MLIKLSRIQKIQANSSGTVTNEYDKDLPKERYISPAERQKIIDDLRLIYNIIA